MNKIIVEIVENQKKEQGCWAIKIRSEGGTVFKDTGYIYEGQGAADRAFCKLLNNLPDKEA